MKSFYPRDQKYALRYIEVNDVGTPLIFIHGLGCASSFEYPHVALTTPLARKHSFLIDLFGSGYSDRPQNFSYSIEDHAQTIFEFVEYLDVGEIDLFGHSMGGTIAIEAATLLKDRVRHLVLSEANLDSGGGEFSRDIARGSESDYIRKKHMETIKDAEVSGNADWAMTMRQSDPKAVYRGAKSLVDGSTSDWREAFYKHPATKTFIFGELSLPTPDFGALAEVGISTQVVQKAGHSMGLENPVGLATAINSALK